jgi:hypothetical protein
MRNLQNRLAKIETSRKGPAAFVVAVPHDAWTNGDDHLRWATANALSEHEHHTGHRGPVMIGVKECLSADEWLSRYAPSA